jgi:hypothetical protein
MTDHEEPTMPAPSTMTVPHWADLLALRPEVTSSDGSVGELQMSLHKAVYQTVDVPYRVASYYADITEPAPHLIGFLGRVARRLGTTADSTALFHLDQGMGGGKSHALVGLYHMAAHPQEFFATEPRSSRSAPITSRRASRRRTSGLPLRCSSGSCGD